RRRHHGLGRERRGAGRDGEERRSGAPAGGLPAAEEDPEEEDRELGDDERARDEVGEAAVALGTDERVAGAEVGEAGGEQHHDGDRPAGRAQTPRLGPLGAEDAGERGAASRREADRGGQGGGAHRTPSVWEVAVRYCTAPAVRLR